jgi:hypothetical protein
MSQSHYSNEKRGRLAQLENEMQARANFFKESLSNLENGLHFHENELLKIKKQINHSKDKKCNGI